MCMKKISVGAVMEGVEKILKEGKKPSSIRS
jgi:hypothetical protein